MAPRSPLVKSLMRKAWKVHWSPIPAAKAPSQEVAKKIKRELANWKTDKNVPLVCSTAQKRLAQLKAWELVVEPRYKAEQQQAIAKAEEMLRAMWCERLREKRQEASSDQDPVLEAIRDRPATAWLESQVADYLARRDGERASEFDPVCEKITHYRRIGRRGRFTLKCYLRSHRSSKRAPQAAFWVKYLDVQALPTAKALLTKYGWRLWDYMDEYSQGESAWNTDFNSADDTIRERKRLRGSEHAIVKKRARA